MDESLVMVVVVVVGVIEEVVVMTVAGMLIVFWGAVEMTEVTSMPRVVVVAVLPVMEG